MARVTVSQLSADVAALANAVESLTRLVAGTMPSPAPLPDVAAPVERKPKQEREYGPMGQCIAKVAKKVDAHGMPKDCRSESTHIVVIRGQEVGLCDTHYRMFNQGTLVHTRLDDVRARRITPEEQAIADAARVPAVANAPKATQAATVASVASRARERNTPACAGVRKSGEPCRSHVLVKGEAYCREHIGQKPATASARKPRKSRTVKVTPVVDATPEPVDAAQVAAMLDAIPNMPENVKDAIFKLATTSR